MCANGYFMTVDLWHHHCCEPCTPRKPDAFQVFGPPPDPRFPVLPLEMLPLSLPYAPPGPFAGG